MLPCPLIEKRPGIAYKTLTHPYTRVNYLQPNNNWGIDLPALGCAILLGLVITVTVIAYLTGKNTQRY